MASCPVNSKFKRRMDSEGERGGLQGGLAGFLAIQPSHHHIRTPPPISPWELLLPQATQADRAAGGRKGCASLSRVTEGEKVGPGTQSRPAVSLTPPGLPGHSESG